MYRNRPIELPPWIARISACDMVLYMLLARFGDMYVLPETMSVYRWHEGSLTSTNVEFGTDIRFHHLSIQILRLMNRYWNRQYQRIIYPKISRYYVECAMNYLRRSQRDYRNSKKMAKMAWLYDKHTAFLFLLKGMSRKIIMKICRR